MIYMMGTESVEEIHTRWKKEQRETCSIAHGNVGKCKECPLEHCRANPKNPEETNEIKRKQTMDS